ncbi:MAG: polysaccharide biosynthesis protein [Acutalibacteraceae bacterium]|nr:polysaccharide biosynthesis protein [Acutalibacteraceae bacterium]
MSRHFNDNDEHTSDVKKTTQSQKFKEDGDYVDINDMSIHISSSKDNNATVVSEGFSSKKKSKKEKGIEQQSFVKGAMIMTISVVVVKIIGALFKVLFANIVDGVGNGLFNSAYELYNVIFTVASAGFPIALSRMVSEYVSKHRYKDVQKIHKISIPFFVTTGFVCFLLMVALSGVYGKMIGNSSIQLPVIALAPIVFFGCLMSIYRGYFEGMRYMVPTAISEIIEVSGKLLVGLTLAYIVNFMGRTEYEQSGTLFGNLMTDTEMYNNTLAAFTVSAAFVGVAVGSLCGFLYLMFKYKRTHGGITKEQLETSPEAFPGKRLFKTLALTAIPIGLGSFVMSIASTIDSILVQNRIVNIMESGNGDVLKSIYSNLKPDQFAVDAYGDYNIQVFLFGCYGYALTFLMLVTAVTQVFGQSAMPALTSAWTVKDKKLIKSNINTILKITLLVTLPAGIGLSVLAKPLLTLLYGVRVEVDIAAAVLQVMGISSIFIATSTPICSMLQAIGRVDMPLKLYTVGMIMKIIINYILVGIPQINIQGAAVGSLVAYLFVSVIGIYIIAKDTGVVPDFRKILLKPLFAAICCGVAAYGSNYVVSTYIMSEGRFTVLPSVIVAVIVYVVALLLFKGITAEDLQEMPGGNKIAKILAKYKLLR